MDKQNAGSAAGLDESTQKSTQQLSELLAGCLAQHLNERQLAELVEALTRHLRIYTSTRP